MARTTDMARAQTAALRYLGIRRVSLLTPYVAAVAEANADMLASAGVMVVQRCTMGLERDTQTSAVAPECIADWAEYVDCDQAEALVIG